MKNIEIKRVTVTDRAELQKIAKQTFFETFASYNSEEDMKVYLAEKFSEETLRSELSDENAEFYFAVMDEKAIGYLKINFGPSQTEIKDDNTLEIERIYVLNDFQGQKAGQKLYEKAIDAARQKSIDLVWLGVWEKNLKAIRFYEKNGFEAFDKHVFKLGNDEQTDIMMKLKIV